MDQYSEWELRNPFEAPQARTKHETVDDKDWSREGECKTEGVGDGAEDWENLLESSPNLHSMNRSLKAEIGGRKSLVSQKSRNLGTFLKEAPKSVMQRETFA